ncbi:E3 ubiquitin-protein ligase SIAH1 isoform X1 [Zootoca vivipara]|uniref:E3 ubiquitin-protein ligase SIAH1 isoform X1 n=1 Tax=Zootoca vivipara TaxID=8524 RepID=UPI0015912842|nr:E3 ubiquitin-protein ligase SIAH1 isoform X1 [Zootoca vivipara]
MFYFSLHSLHVWNVAPLPPQNPTTVLLGKNILYECSSYNPCRFALFSLPRHLLRKSDLEAGFECIFLLEPLPSFDPTFKCFCLLSMIKIFLGKQEMSRQTATALPTGTSKCTPSQRVPALTGTTASNNDLASLFECPVCFDYVLPPILQCQSGHLVCSNCRPKLTCCPTCRGPLGSIRNLAMEKVANSVLFPCKYASSGCEITLPHTEKADHEELCEFRPYSCPCPGASCKWQGSLDAVMPHLMHQHKSITTLQGEDIVFLATDINLPGAVDWVMMQSCFGFHFMLVLEKQEKYDGHQQFFAIVQLIGTRKQAENFAYRLELNGHRRRLTWEATPRSIHEGIATAIMNSDCLVFDTSIAQLFAENGNLGINVTISMC